MLKKINWHLFLEIFISSGHLVAIVLVITHIFPSTGVEAKYAISFMGMSIILMLILIYLNGDKLEKQKTFYEDKLNAEVRKSKYAEVIKDLNGAWAKIDSIYRDENANQQDYIKVFTEYCTILSSVYQKLTNVPCGVCIKLIQRKSESNEELTTMNCFAYDFIRDSLNPERDNGAEIEHNLKDNTDFETIFKNIQSDKGRIFFSNNLIEHPHYKSTSFLKYDNYSISYPDGTSKEHKANTWPLKYKSTMVAPICPNIHKQRNTSMLLGFICVDANIINAFTTEDQELLIGCSDGIWNVLNKFLLSLKNSKEN